MSFYELFDENEITERLTRPLLCDLLNLILENVLCEAVRAPSFIREHIACRMSCTTSSDYFKLDKEAMQVVVVAN